MKHWLALAALVCFGSNASALAIRGAGTDSSKVAKAGDTMTGDLSGKSIILTGGISASTAAITYVQASSITLTNGATVYGTLTVDGTAGKIALQAAGGVGASGSGFIDLTNAGYSASLSHIGSGAANTIVYGVPSGGSHQFNVANTNRFFIAADGFTILSAAGNSTRVSRILKTATASTDLGAAITATCTAETNFSITGVAVGDSCTVTTPAAIGAADWIICRTLVNNVALKYCTQGAAVDPAAMVYTITTIEYD